MVDLHTYIETDEWHGSGGGGGCKETPARTTFTWRLMFFASSRPPSIQPPLSSTFNYVASYSLVHRAWLTAARSSIQCRLRSSLCRLTTIQPSATALLLFCSSGHDFVLCLCITSQFNAFSGSSSSNGQVSDDWKNNMVLVEWDVN